MRWDVTGTYSNHNKERLLEVLCLGSVDVVDFFHVPGEETGALTLPVGEHREEVDADCGQESAVKAATLVKHLVGG